MLLERRTQYGANDLIALQKAVFDGYITNVWQTLGMFLVAIGWVVTSNKARKFLAYQCVVRLTCISAACAILVIHLLVLHASFIKSERLTNHIKNTKIWVCENADAQSKHRKPEMTILDVYRIPKLYPIVSGSLATILVLSFVVMVHQPRTQGTGRNSKKAIDIDTK